MEGHNNFRIYSNLSLKLKTVKTKTKIIYSYSKYVAQQVLLKQNKDVRKMGALNPIKCKNMRMKILQKFYTY